MPSDGSAVLNFQFSIFNSRFSVLGGRTLIHPKPSATTVGDLLDRRWVGMGYAAFALALLLLAALPIANVVGRFPAAPFLLILLLSVPLTGVLLSRGRRSRGKLPALTLLL